MAKKAAGKQKAKRPQSSVQPLVFISHATCDKWLAKVLCREIETCGCRTFRDDRDINGGASIPEAIKDAIRECSQMVVLLTPESIAREWVMIEIGIAVAFDKSIVPILLYVEPDDMPESLRMKRAFRLNEIESFFAGLS